MTVIFAILVLSGVFKEDMQLHVNLPVAFDNEEIGYIVANQTPSQVQIVKAYGDIHFIDTPHQIAKLYMIPMVIGNRYDVFSAFYLQEVYKKCPQRHNFRNL